MRIRIVFFVLCFVASCSVGVAQDKAPGLPAVENLQDFYRTGVGVKVGWPIASLSFKHFVSKRNALEVLAAPKFGGGSFTFLAEHHVPARRPGIYWYYGAGLSAGMFDGDSYKDYEGQSYDRESVFSVSFAPIIGIEMNIHETPFSVSFDVKPRIGIINPGGSVFEGGVALKYIWSW